MNICSIERAAKEKQNPQMLRVCYFICGEKWHMEQGPNFKLKPVVQGTPWWSSG